VKKRAKGQIHSPVLETLLSYNSLFQKHPEEEFRQDFIKTYRTSQHPKAKGIDFQIEYPASWKANDGIRPNVIKHIQSKNGYGPDFIAIMAKDISLPKGYKLSKGDIEEQFSYDELKDMIPSGASFIDAKSVILDRQRGGILIYEQVGERLEKVLMIRTLSFITIYQFCPVS
jgi:hypothetical protein